MVEAVLDWKDFPKGLHILVADKDPNSLAEIKHILESFHYFVTTFSNGEAALQALQSEQCSFHLALVEVVNENLKGLKILAAAKHLPIIMMSSTEDMNIIMQSIASGAADFLRKPIPDENLRNIWQHVARKALSGDSRRLVKAAVKCQHSSEVTFASESCLAPAVGSLTTITATLNNSFRSNSFVRPKDEAGDSESQYITSKNAKDCGIKIELDESFNDMTVSNCMVVDDDDKQDFELESILKPCDSSLGSNDEAGEVHDTESIQQSEQGTFSSHVIQAKQGSSRQTERVSATRSRKKEHVVKEMKKASAKNKTKVDWSPELHRLFVQAVEKLGSEKAIPSRILEVMGVKCLTRHNIASHLQQKYRAHKKFRSSEMNMKSFDTNSIKRDGILPIQPRPFTHPIYPFIAPGHAWGHPAAAIDHSTGHNWPWQAPATWHQNSVPSSGWRHCSQPPLNDEVRPGCVLASPSDACSKQTTVQPKEGIDAAISEALLKPWAPLPIGLSPPSMECVIAELHSKGIITTPPTKNIL